jgi:hypothetical protein
MVTSDSEITNNNILNTAVTDVAEKMFDTEKADDEVSYNVAIMQHLFKNSIPENDVYDNSGTDERQSFLADNVKNKSFL